jgi:hypothetical protein
MPAFARKLSGAQGPARSSTNTPARDNTTKAAYWCAHRMGPFLVHRVGACVPTRQDNPGYTDDLAHAIAQGFIACPRCLTY